MKSKKKRVACIVSKLKIFSKKLFLINFCLWCMWPLCTPNVPENQNRLNSDSRNALHWSQIRYYDGCYQKQQHLKIKQIKCIMSKTFWLIWQSCQWAYTIMNCLSCVIIGIIVIIVVIIICGQSSCPQVWSQNFIFCTYMHIYAHMPLVYAHELVSKYNLYFLNGSHFSSILYVDLLTTWFNLEPS